MKTLGVLKEVLAGKRMSDSSKRNYGDGGKGEIRWRCG